MIFDAMLNINAIASCMDLSLCMKLASSYITVGLRNTASAQYEAWLCGDRLGEILYLDYKLITANM